MDEGKPTRVTNTLSEHPKLSYRIPNKDKPLLRSARGTVIAKPALAYIRYRYHGMSEFKTVGWKAPRAEPGRGLCRKNSTRFFRDALHYTPVVCKRRVSFTIMFSLLMIVGDSFVRFRGLLGLF